MTKQQLAERVLKSGSLSKETSYRLIVSGPIGAREIEWLIKQLEFEKEILADDGSEKDEPHE